MKWNGSMQWQHDGGDTWDVFWVKGSHLINKSHFSYNFLQEIFADSALPKPQRMKVRWYLWAHRILDALHCHDFDKK